MGFPTKIIRTLREWWRPSLKCKRLGHLYKIVPLRRYEYPGTYYSAVADEVRLNQEVCRRCGAKGVLREIHRGPIQSLTMPSEQWEQLERNGYYVLSN